MKSVIIPEGNNHIIAMNDYFASMLPKPYDVQIIPAGFSKPDHYEIGLCDDEGSFHIGSNVNAKNYIAPEFKVERLETKDGKFIKIDVSEVSPRAVRRLAKALSGGKFPNVKKFLYSDLTDWGVEDMNDWCLGRNLVTAGFPDWVEDGSFDPKILAVAMGIGLRITDEAHMDDTVSPHDGKDKWLVDQVRELASQQLEDSNYLEAMVKCGGSLGPTSFIMLHPDGTEFTKAESRDWFDKNFPNKD